MLKLLCEKEMTIQKNAALAKKWVSFWEECLKIIQEKPHETITLSLKEVKHLDTSGLQMLLSFIKTAKANNGTIVLEDIPEEMAQIFKMIGVSL